MNFFSITLSDDFNLAPGDSANVSFHKYQVPSKKILQQDCRLPELGFLQSLLRVPLKYSC